MADLLFLAVTIGFFAIATLLVRACDHIVGPDLDLAAAPDGSDAEVGPESAVVR